MKENIVLFSIKVMDAIKNLISDLEMLLPIANSHLVSFITQDSFEKLVPKYIQSEILSLSINELNDIAFNSISNIVCNNKKAPKLIEFLHKTQELSLKQSRFCVPYEKFCEIMNIQNINESRSTQNCMSPKKFHEVQRLSSIIAQLSNTSDYSHIVDIGGGKGYLSSTLALKHSFKVLSIDSSLSTSKSAAKQLSKLQKTSSKNRTNDNTNGKMQQEPQEYYKLATMFITEHTNVMEVVQDNYQGDEINGVMLTGLHTCGNLAASSLRLFSNNLEYVKCLVNIGCCYNLIVEEFEESPLRLELQAEASGSGFPLSSYLKNMNFVLGRNARMLAAQALERISHTKTLQTEITFLRALLEFYLKSKLSDEDGLLNFRVGRLGQKCSNFVEYVHKSIDHLGLDIKVDDEELQQLYDSHSVSRQQFYAFFMLRLALAPAIEAIIMLDRLLYLHEQGIPDAFLVQIFDPVVSPRCFAIVAFNKPNEITRRLASEISL